MNFGKVSGFAPCRTVGCKHRVRVGLKRHGTGADGQRLADGEFCWRCRGKQASREQKR